MFKKKEILIIFVLAVLVTGLSWLVVRSPYRIGYGTDQRGWPLAYWIVSYELDGESVSSITLNSHIFLLDFLFWLFVIEIVVGGFWLVSEPRNRGRKVKMGLAVLLIEIIIAVLIFYLPVYLPLPEWRIR